MNRDVILLRHILECIDWIGRHTCGSRDLFFEDRKTRSAVIRELQTLAESCQHLSDEAKARRPDIFWPGIGGFRNVLVHDYLGTNNQRVWAVVDGELPKLKAAVEELLVLEDQRDEAP